MRNRYFGPVLTVALCVMSTGCYENFGDTVRVTAFGDINAIPANIGIRANTDDIFVSYSVDYQDSKWLALRRSYDGGASWGSWSGIHDAGDLQLNDSFMVADNEHSSYVYAAVAEGAVFPTFQGSNYFMRSADSGYNWSTTYDFFNTDHEYYEPRIAQHPSDPNTIVYTEQRRTYTGESRIRAHLSSDRGVTFDYHTDVVAEADEPWTIDLMYMDDGTLLFFYSLNNADMEWPLFYLKRSTDDGRTWGSPIMVNSHVSGSLAMGGALVQFGTTLHATWGTEANYKHSFSNDGGLTWEDNEIIEWNWCITPDLLYSETQAALVLSYVQYDPENWYNLHYRIWGSEWSEEGRINNHLGSTSASAGMTNDSAGIVYSAFNDNRWFDAEGYEVAIAASDPAFGNLTSAVQVVLDATTVFGDVSRGDAISFSFTASNDGDAAETVDVWIKYEGANGISGTLKNYRNVTLQADQSGSATYSTRVPAVAPFQDYHLTVHVGPAGMSSSEDSDGFTATVIP